VSRQIRGTGRDIPREFERRGFAVLNDSRGRFVYRITRNATEEGLGQVQAMSVSCVLLHTAVDSTRIVRTVARCKAMLAEATTYDGKHPPDWMATVCMNPRTQMYHKVPCRLRRLAEREAGCCSDTQTRGALHRDGLIVCMLANGGRPDHWDQFLRVLKSAGPVQLVLTSSARKSRSWMRARVRQYRSMLTAEVPWSEPFRR
jgi:hypothetical protein